MARYFISFDGDEDDAGTQVAVEHDSVDEARNAAIALLGRHLQEHPSFAYLRHWRVDVRDSSKRLLLHVIVATVDAPKPINWASYD